MSGPASPDRFGGVAEAYATFRPQYPAGLYAELARLVPRTVLAWDCATGNGQAALALAGHFDRVIATDFSAGQLACATTSDQVSYVRARAEAAPLRTASADLVTVAQALHWFDIDAFWSEVRRVLRPDGVVAVWCYDLPRTTGPLDRIIDHYYRHTVGPYWAPERRLVEDAYRSVRFPFDPIEMTGFEITADFSLDQLVGYIGTWSATIACRGDTGEDPLPALRFRLERDWPAAHALVAARWPVAVRAGRNQGAAADRR